MHGCARPNSSPTRVATRRRSPTSTARFQPEAQLTQGQLATAIAATDKLLRPDPTVTSTVPANATLAGVVPWQIAVAKQSPEDLQLLVDGTEVANYPYTQLDTTK